MCGEMGGGGGKGTFEFTLQFYYVNLRAPFCYVGTFPGTC